jgi:hypothetical protein
MQQLATVKVGAKFEILNQVGRLENTTDYDFKIMVFI